MIVDAPVTVFCYTSKPNNSANQQVNNYEKVMTTSML